MICGKPVFAHLQAENPFWVSVSWCCLPSAVHAHYAQSLYRNRFELHHPGLCLWLLMQLIPHRADSPAAASEVHDFRYWEISTQVSALIRLVLLSCYSVAVEFRAVGGRDQGLSLLNNWLVTGEPLPSAHLHRDFSALSVWAVETSNLCKYPEGKEVHQHPYLASPPCLPHLLWGPVLCMMLIL